MLSALPNLLLSPPGDLFISSPFEGKGGLNRDGEVEGGRGNLFNLGKTMVSVLYKELEYKAEKLKNKKVGGHMQPRIRIKSEHPVGKSTIPDQSIRSFTVVID